MVEEACLNTVVEERHDGLVYFQFLLQLLTFFITEQKSITGGTTKSEDTEYILVLSSGFGDAIHITVQFGVKYLVVSVGVRGREINLSELFISHDYMSCRYVCKQQRKRQKER